MILVSCLSLFLFTISTHCAELRFKRQDDSSTTCTTPDGTPGTCISVRDCPILLEVLKRASTNSDSANFLRRSRCGGYAQVCCGSEVNSSNENNGGDNTSESSSDLQVCGKSAVRQSNRVVGGQPADLGAWPWIAALGYKEVGKRNPEVMWRCGGSLINKKYILTAAHCIRTPPNIPVQLLRTVQEHRSHHQNLRVRVLLYVPDGKQTAASDDESGALERTVVRLGEHDLVNETEGASPVDYGVERSIVHEGYKSQTNDIALIKLDRDVAYTDRIRPICLPSSAELRSNTFEKKYPFVVGWGETNLNGPSSNVLLQVQVPVVDNESCRVAYAKHGATIRENQLCAGEQKGGKDSCRGDSGGPLMLPQGGSYFQIGIISFGYRCAEPGYPGVYSRVTSYLDWIKTNTNGL